MSALYMGYFHGKSSTIQALWSGVGTGRIEKDAFLERCAESYGHYEGQVTGKSSLSVGSEERGFDHI